MQLAFELDGAEGCRVLVERSEAPGHDALDTAFWASAGPLRRSNARSGFSAMLADCLGDPAVRTIVGIRNAELVLDEGLTGRLRAALARLQGLGRPWSIGAAGGLAPNGVRACALYSAETPFLPVEPHPLPLLDPLPDLWIADVGFLRQLCRGGRALPECGLETVIALRGWLAGRVALSLPELVAGVNGPLRPRDIEKFAPALGDWLGPGQEGTVIDTLMGPVTVPGERSSDPRRLDRTEDLGDRVTAAIADACEPLSLSIVTRTRFGRPHLLDRLLASISRARIDGQALEIVLSTDVDAREAERHLAAIRERFINLDVRLAVNREAGPSRVVNLTGGIRAARNDYVAVVDDDDYLDLFAFDMLARTRFLGARPLIVASTGLHDEEWTETQNGRHVLTRSEAREGWPADNWRSLFSGVNALPVCAMIMPRDRLLARLDAFALRHDLSEDYALWLLMLTDPALPPIVECAGPFAHVSVREGGDNSVTMTDRRPWVRDIALYLADLTGDPAVAGPGVWQMLSHPRPAEPLAAAELARCCEALARHAPGASLTLCLNDEPPPGLDLAGEPFARVWQPADLGYDRAWVFQHDVMELCTAVKGRALRRLMEEEPEADLYLYLDPDVYVFNPLDLILPMMGEDEIGLVPHILAPEETDLGVRMTEMSVTEHGIYNLGHLVLRPGDQTRAFARWWSDRLDRYCFDERERGLFTDQRWVDLVPAIFDRVRILKSPALDVASWNLSGREIRHVGVGDHRSFTVDGEPLVTYHFSGTGPNGTHRRVRHIFDPGNGATAEIERLYEAAIARHGQAELGGARPAFDLFDDGTPVTAEARRLYRRHADLQAAFPDPYRAGPSCYRDWLREQRPGLVDGLRVAPHRLARAFGELFDAEWYLAAHPTAAEAVAAGQYRDAEDHYVRIGSHLLFDPNEFFVSSYYLDRAADLEPYRIATRAGRREGTLLWHYLETGLPNGIEPIEFFDGGWYLERNADVRDALQSGRVSCPLAHFLRYGGAEGREPGPGFQSGSYLEAEPEARRLVDHKQARGPFGAFVRLGNVAGRVAV